MLGNSIFANGGIDALRNTVVQVAEFTSADSNYGHRVLALLLLEGAIDVLTTNWDTCIERGGLPDGGGPRTGYRGYGGGIEERSVAGTLVNASAQP